MDAMKIMRELNALDALEKRINQTVNPSQILLEQIRIKRQNLIGESNAAAQKNGDEQKPKRT